MAAPGASSKKLRDPCYDIRKYDLRAKLTEETYDGVVRFARETGWSRQETIEYLIRYAIMTHEENKWKL